MARGPHERALETLEDLDARLAGLEVAYSEENAAAAEDLVEELERFFETEPETLVALRDAVTELVDSEDPDLVSPAEEHADELRRRIEAELDDGE